MKKINGFTLAEVLITLVIIGIIAAMTIPTLMNKTNEQETVVAVKKAYSVLSQAYQRMVAENGELNPSYFGSSSEVATKNFAEIFVKYLNVQKVCGLSTNEDCWSTQNGGMYKHFDGSDSRIWNTETRWSYYKIRLSDGMSLGIRGYATYYERGTTEALLHTLADIHVDINGDKGPNTYGKDVFTFWLSKYGVLPYGSPYDTDSNSVFSTCKTTGLGCTAWVVTKGNMDYLRKDVSW